jgi:transcriptional regulator with XRE-family HTH domain
VDLVLRLRELRRMSGLSQREVGQSSGVGEKTLSSFETGDRVKSIKVVQLLAILNAYHVTPAEFFGDGVERRLLAELERLSPAELKIVTGLRALPDVQRERLLDRFLIMLEAIEATAGQRLRALR